MFKFKFTPVFGSMLIHTFPGVLSLSVGQLVHSAEVTGRGVTEAHLQQGTLHCPDGWRHKE